MQHEPNCNAYVGGGKCNCRYSQENRITPLPEMARTDAGFVRVQRVGRGLDELQRRVAEAREVVTCACNHATRPEQIEAAAKHYGDALREYRAALESPTGKHSDTAQ